MLCPNPLNWREMACGGVAAGVGAGVGAGVTRGGGGEVGLALALLVGDGERVVTGVDACPACRLLSHPPKETTALLLLWR